jgi:hypothetical protein
MITQTPSDVPFDVQHLRYIHYHPNNEGLQAMAQDTVRAVSPTAGGRDRGRRVGGAFAPLMRMIAWILRVGLALLASTHLCALSRSCSRIIGSGRSGQSYAGKLVTGQIR